MIIKHSTAISVAFAVWFAFSVPAQGASRAIRRSGLPTSIVQTDDDDDDDLSGGALAVLLLAIGGAVAGVLYAAHGDGHQSVACDRKANELTLTMKTTDAKGKLGRSRTWDAKLDDKSGTITLVQKAINAGRATRSQWAGKVDGKYHSVTGDSLADEISYTKIDANTLEFSAKKGDHVTLTGRMVVANNGRSFTIKTERTDSTGRRIIKQTTYSSGPKERQNP